MYKIMQSLLWKVEPFQSNKLLRLNEKKIRRALFKRRLRQFTLNESREKTMHVSELVG